MASHSRQRNTQLHQFLRRRIQVRLDAVNGGLLVVQSVPQFIEEESGKIGLGLEQFDQSPERIWILWIRALPVDVPFPFLFVFLGGHIFYLGAIRELVVRRDKLYLAPDRAIPRLGSAVVECARRLFLTLGQDQVT